MAPLEPEVSAFTSKIHNDTYPEIDPLTVDHAGRYVVIVGASKGIGREMARSFTKAGASGIAIGARSALSSTVEAIKQAATESKKSLPKILPLNLDVNSEDSIAKAFSKVKEEFGRVDILVNNAGVVESPFRPIGDTVARDWWDVFTTNLRGTYLTTRAFLPLLLEKGSQKTVINTTSIAAHWVYPGSSAYGTSKLGVVRLTEFLDEEYSPRGLLTYTIHPGAIMTDLISRMPKEVHSQMTDTEALPANVITYLTSERQEWLGGRYIACTWDVPELLARKDEIVAGNKLKVRLRV
ncbi:uncharacterized protein A1O5_11678 [Cladophialophora psammophila CBS 110553]|uniref:Oxidoreductase n=1 Tax=Cladophialophora psammophila CBS 110553 TaxID=1182543 RepID=W9W5L6_9EURO|nr:uncharacterized protein A1O5_11678 [Cladophialophora psammophila CBS 110553]EXJ63357.1 hypothetical protein A1O5_11678 [Cladophialophora psammophila CBS 110553]